ncbi:hypothetical protein BDV30DRAFT_236103 [Aspergillus minisclerotigenes]|uniref:Uncharacterized protein n=1 Tax=Aspergillus minisclerotigenes TaxID=656917 RepID=A0A5N6JC40_9EURO|nr:hypothetical protein BDV30DRAFT_236103 [Aspergillus minisclerotigenes]
MADKTNTNHFPTRCALDADENMRQAIERFRTRMAAANRMFIRQRIDEIEARGLATEKEKLDQMRDYRYFENLGTGGEAEWGTAETRSKENRIRQTTWLADVPTLEDALLVEFDGVIRLPMFRQTEQWRQIYLDTLQQVFQRQADDWAAEEGDEAPGPIPPCHELGLFLKYAQGVRDPDFRHSGIALFEPGFTTGVTDRDLEGLDPSQERNKVQELLSQDRTRLRERLEQDKLEPELINRALIEGLVDDDLEVKAGFVTGTGYCGEYPEWYSAYLYCRRCVDDEDDDEEDKGLTDKTEHALNLEDWAWRVVFFEASIENPRVLYGLKARFDSIPEFLDWYSSWLDHLDARGLLRLRRHRVDCETDCESDCELHYFGSYGR